jgi:uncharacterized alpha-E superfamily protein
MLSRTAQAIYWMSRYVERAENVARFIEVNGHLMLDLPLTPANQWEALLYTTGDQDLFKEHYAETTRENVIEFLTFYEKNPNSIASCLFAARENARSIREIISSEMWEQINKFYHMVQNSDRRRAIDSMHTYYTNIKEASHLFTGITYTTMPRDEAWYFGHLGGLLERADKTSRILDVKYFLLLPSITDIGTPFDNIQWSALLKSTSGLEAYRKKHGNINPENVVEFLVLDHVFPRSIQYCLMEAQKTIGAITGSPSHTFHNPVEQKLGRVSAQLNYTNIEEIFTIGLHEFLDQTQLDINEVDQATFETFFTIDPTETSV